MEPREFLERLLPPTPDEIVAGISEIAEKFADRSPVETASNAVGMVADTVVNAVSTFISGGRSLIQRAASDVEGVGRGIANAVKRTVM